MKKVTLLLVFLLSGMLLHASVTIGGLKYMLDKSSHTAIVDWGNCWEGELEIPEVVSYDGEDYTVNQFHWLAFQDCKSLTKVTIPKTIVGFYSFSVDPRACKNPFSRCTNLREIVVASDNPQFRSVDGVLYSKDMKELCCYPAGKRDTSYDIPDGVEELKINAFDCNEYLQSVQMPNSVTFMSAWTFGNCKRLSSVKISKGGLWYISDRTFDGCESLHFLDIPENIKDFGAYVFINSPLDTIVIRGTFPYALSKSTFYSLTGSTVIYAQPSEIDKFKRVSSCTVLPISSYVPSSITMPTGATATSSLLFDLQGRYLTRQPQHGIYIRDGKKVVVK